MKKKKCNSLLKIMCKKVWKGHRFLTLYSLFFLFGATMLYAQQQQVSGVIKDAIGEPIIGANVSEKGTTNGAITDLDGNYTLSVKPNAILLISYIGYETQEIPVGNQSIINVSLKENLLQLDEVVVVGFGTQKKVNLTGAVGVATSKEIEARPVTSATQALQGLVPGLKISTSTGELDKTMSISVRGTGTIGSGSSGSPLILIDGMEGDLNTVNPQDIETISVLKDAAASSIYGSRAPFGVILVTTKKGTEGKASINYNNSFRFASPMNLPKSMDSYTFANMMNQALINNGNSAKFTNDTMQKMLDYQAGILTGGLDANAAGTAWEDIWSKGYANVDLYDETYRSSVFSQEHNLSISGGSQKITYYASFNYLGQGGMLKMGDDGLNRFNANAKIGASLTDWLKFNYSIRFTRNDVWRPTYFGASNYYNMYGRGHWPNMPQYDPNGYRYYTYHSADDSAPRESRTDRLYHQASFVIEPIKNWITNVEVNYSTVNAGVKEVSYPANNHLPDGSVNDTGKDTYLYKNDTEENYLNLNIYSSYSQTLADKHNFKVMAGFQAEEMKQDYFAVTKYGLMFNNMPQFDLTTGLSGKGVAKDPSISGNYNEWATAGFFGRLNYDYEGRYLFEVNMRYDGTSRFRSGSRWNLSPSFSAGWNMAQEKFFAPANKFIDQLKLRFSYGELGNQNTTSWYPTYRSMSLGSLNGGWLTASGTRPNTASIGGLVSTSLTWETVRTWNAGVDYAFLNSRLSGSFDYFVRQTKNMVGPAPQLPNTLGITVPRTNNCDLSTKGWELSINWKDRLENGLSYGINLSLSDQTTYIDSYPGNLTESIDNYMAGKKDGLIWGFETIGIAKSDAEMDAHIASLPNGGQSAIGTQWKAGDIMYKDLNGDGKISTGSRTWEDHGDLKILGDSYSHYFYGIDLNAEWKGFDFRCFLQGVLKKDFWPGIGDASTNETQTGGYFWGVPGAKSEWHMRGFVQHEDYFRSEPIGLAGHEIPANIDSYFPRVIVNNGGKNQRVQSRYLQNAAYCRLKNLQLGYTLPSTFVRKAGISKCRLFVSGENLLTFSPIFSVFDPETCSGGVGGNAYPLSRTWSFGLSLTL